MEPLKRREDAILIQEVDSVVHKHFNCVTGVTENTGVYTTYPLYQNSYFVGFDTPRFHSRVRKGELIPFTPWRQYECIGHQECGYDVRRYNTSCIDTYYAVGNSATQSNSTYIVTEEMLAEKVPSAYNKYVNEAAAAIYSHGFDALTFLAEATEIPKMFAGGLRKLIRLDLPKNWRSLSNDWLEARYGWRSLVYDVKNIHELISSFNEKRSRFSESRGTKYTDRVSTVSPIYGSTHYSYQIIDDIEYTVAIRGSVAADISIPKIQFNPIVTAWEIIPLSFVVDWFLSVGRAIEAASFLATQTDFTAAKSYYITAKRHRYSTITGLNSGVISADGSEHHQYCEAGLKVRTPCSIPLTPHLTFRVNDFKVLDLLALASQRYRR